MASLVIEVHKKRHTVKTTPMQPLLAVVGEALKAAGLEDVDPAACRLFQGKKQITDLSTPVRFSNLPSGTKLELLTGREPRLGFQDIGAAASSAAAPSATAAAVPASTAAPSGVPTARPAVATAPAPMAQPAAAAPTPPAAGVGMQPQPPALQPSPAMAQQQQQQQQPAAPAPAAAPAEAGASSSGAEGSMELNGPSQQAQQAQQAQHASVAVFGQEVYVFTREAELAAESAHMAIDDREVPDDFYEFTEGDFRRVAAGLARAKAQAESSTLMTKQMRESEEARRAAAFGPVMLRVNLPDGHVLQVSFQAAHPLSKLRGVVRRALAEAVGERFHLFTTPPKALLKDMAASFYQARLIPAARVHVGLDAPLPEGTPLLRPEVLALLGPPPDKASAVHRQQGTGGAAAAPVGNGGDKRRGGSGGAAAAAEGPSGSGRSAGPSGASAGGESSRPGVPKWLKLAKK